MKAVYKLDTPTYKSAIVKNYTEGLGTSAIKEIKSNLVTEFSKSDNKEILLDGIILNIRFDTLKEPVKLGIENASSCIRLDFEIEGNSVFTPEDENSLLVKIPNNHFNFFYFPKVKGNVTYNTAKRKSVSVMVTPAFLEKAFNNSLALIAADFNTALVTQQPFVMYPNSKKIPTALSIMLNDIITCSFQTEIKQVYLESKIKEIFSYLFSEMNLQP